ncbi:cytochrome c oxidase subunit II [Methylopila sp. Yamaguchi]|uniref:cytochrome c oxidase subunit II n=1 Tax=Methylopila sp. Yamaguchi TaxID=1437817 RepID=UPI000CC57851|nr:cytochrome c oxidase subunit II [Methylopila sp. Yamaguchi]GBD50178.1 cytochrome c oxidase subunit II [Methylopila sp. Yamaguchi]
MSARRLVSLVLAAASCAACSPIQSALDPQSPQAESLHELFWLFVVVCSVVWLAVMASLTLALLRNRSTASEATAAGSRTPALAVGAAVVATVLIVAGLTIASFLATRSLATDGGGLVIKLRGYQWWWEATYPAEGVVTANEIHLPVGRPVRMELSAADVIHSFWVPQLQGKLDLIPGRDNAVTITVTKEGVYRGQCAEFCGLQHAHMGLIVVAEPPAAFDAWARAQAAVAAAPTEPEAQAGAALFQAKACSSCHAIRGTAASAKVGPDLTHVASRRSIAADVLPATRGAFAAWIVDPQTIKPGANMPAIALEPAELRALSAYMTALK